MHCNPKAICNVIERLAEYTEPEDKGFTRFSYTSSDLKAREYVIAVMRENGLDVSMDLPGNIFGRRRGIQDDLPAVVMGSHLDTVKNGGKYDGIAGVAAALEVLRVMKTNNIMTRHPVEVIAFAEEEGGRFGSAFVGSSWITGQLNENDLGKLKDARGISVLQAVKDLDPLNDRVKRVHRRAGSIKAFLELHCEQGPVLENGDKDLGNVSSITGSSSYMVSIYGQSDHAGTTPMDVRKDAFNAAAKISVELNRFVNAHPEEAVGTVGYVEVRPNVYNIVPEQASFTMDIRSHSGTAMDDIIGHMKEYITSVCCEDGLEYKIEKRHYKGPTKLSGDVARLIANSAASRGYDYMEMGSGAGHDAMVMASVTDVAMVFVPSRNGRSHCLEEFSKMEDIAKGADVFLDTVIELAG